MYPLDTETVTSCTLTCVSRCVSRGVGESAVQQLDKVGPKVLHIRPWSVHVGVRFLSSMQDLEQNPCPSHAKLAW